MNYLNYISGNKLNYCNYWSFNNWWYQLLFFNKSWSSIRVCPRSVIVSIIYKWSAKLVFLLQVEVYTILEASTLSTSLAEENALEFTLTLNTELNNVNNWVTSKYVCICINDDKRKYMIFSYRKLLHLTNIKIGSVTTEETNNIKFFGIILINILHSKIT